MQAIIIMASVALKFLIIISLPPHRGCKTWQEFCRVSQQLVSIHHPAHLGVREKELQ